MDGGLAQTDKQLAVQNGWMHSLIITLIFLFVCLFFPIFVFLMFLSRTLINFLHS